MPPTETVWCIGYQRLDVEGLITALRSEGVVRLIDVRAAPWSQRPEFRRDALRPAIEAAGLAYRHEPDAGNPFRGDPGWRDRFEAHLSRYPEVLYGLESLCSDAPSALMCVCPRSATCHRGVLLDVMATRGWTVVELPRPRQMSLLDGDI